MVGPRPSGGEQHPTVVAPSAYDISQLKLQGVFRGAKQTYAIVNGGMATVGTVIAGARVVEVFDDRVVFVPVGQGDAAKFELTLQRK